MKDGKPNPDKFTLIFDMIILVLILMFFNSPFAFADDQAIQQTVGGFNLVQYDDGGGKKWTLNGKSAEVEDKKIKIDEISALTFGEGEIFKLKAKTGSFDRENGIVHLEDNVVMRTTDGITLKTDSLNWVVETKNAFTDRYVNIKKGDLDVSGIGAEFDFKAKTAELKKDIVANITSLGTSYLTASNKEQVTTITCDGPLELNYKKNRATFFNKVKVKDKEGDIFADRIDVYFSPSTRRIKCVVARGNVRIVNGENVTYSEKAIYLVDEGRVILPKRPKLVIQTEDYDSQ